LNDGTAILPPGPDRIGLVPGNAKGDRVGNVVLGLLGLVLRIDTGGENFRANIAKSLTVFGEAD
jgi:hypothetical protein